MCTGSHLLKFQALDPFSLVRLSALISASKTWTRLVSLSSQHVLAKCFTEPGVMSLRDCALHRQGTSVALWKNLISASVHPEFLESRPRHRCSFGRQSSQDMVRVRLPQFQHSCAFTVCGHPLLEGPPRDRGFPNSWKPARTLH